MKWKRSKKAQAEAKGKDDESKREESPQTTGQQPVQGNPAHDSSREETLYRPYVG